jgi:hypothetical protein
MQVTYTHLDGNVAVFTANTKVFTKNFIGNIIEGVTTPESDASLLAIPDTTIVVKQVTINGVDGVQNVTKTIFIKVDETYVTDYGMHIWAKERLSAQELTSFTEHIDSIEAAGANASDNAEFMRWWKKYTSDPNVKVEN